VIAQLRRENARLHKEVQNLEKKAKLYQAKNKTMADTMAMQGLDVMDVSW
jgi:hypothetical protein